MLTVKTTNNDDPGPSATEVAPAIPDTPIASIVAAIGVLHQQPQAKDKITIKTATITCQFALAVELSNGKKTVVAINRRDIVALKSTDTQINAWTFEAEDAAGITLGLRQFNLKPNGILSGDGDCIYTQVFSKNDQEIPGFGYFKDGKQVRVTPNANQDDSSATKAPRFQ